MNKIVSLSSNILSSILQEKIAFNLAISHGLKNQKISQNDRTLIVKLVGCSLRHYYIFAYLIQTHFPSINLHNQTIVYLYLSNKLFVHAFSNEEGSKLLSTSLLQSDEIKAQSVIDEFEEATNDRKNLIPSNLDKTSVEFLSYRFNTPVWLIKMWQKHFGEHLTFRILQANSKPSTGFSLVDTFASSREELIKKYPDLLIAPFADFVTTSSKENIKKHPSFISKEIFDVSPCFQTLFTQCDVDPLRGIAIYSGYLNHAYLSLVAKFGKAVKFDLILSDDTAFFASKKDINEYGLINAAYYEAEPSSIITCISKPVHTFFVFPENSHLSLLKSNPDYFLHFEQSLLDGIIKNEELALNECASLVEEDGELIYAIPTINKKESRRLIHRFLESHPDFTLLTERQIFPFSEFEESFYFAILKKETLKNA